MQVGFDVHTDMRDDAKAGAKDTIGFTAWQLPERHGRWRHRRRQARGVVRRRQDLEPAGPQRQAWVTGRRPSTYPADASKWVSLKATAWDDAGNRSSQTIIRAYGLR